MSIDYIEQFKIDYQLKLVPKTIRGYEFNIRQLLEQMEKPFEDITRKDVRNWLMLLEEKGYKPLTVYTKLIGVKTFYKYCMEEGLITKDPVEHIPYPKIPDKVPTYLTKPELAQLRACVQHSLLERAIIEVFVATGVRVSELVAMNKEDINETERSIHIPEGKGNKGRIVLISLESLHYLTAYLKSRTDALPYVFINQAASNRLRRQKINANFQAYSTQLGFRVIPHMLRHTFATHLAQKGMPLECIQELLGHQRPATTQLYSRLFNQARKETYDRWM
ncbi:tyrosine-type recombinase/integrase [Jeotgalibacillus sp. ET6]|uniref:tyrosine-type recombinase/integrase n=1 Tax=Jeotgalibacillus sp. ET6 TaxID=3037260 RepID=UPI0024185C82|nr:tyrosine-type recombinase/integrase [Jeotgalibacillus sp. ET6]MDG5473691.1 tyrosine-type recombinase/integrase [Jeotgalibacillus sp. ET6]